MSWCCLMPDQRLARARASLPSDYQYGDAASVVEVGINIVHFKLAQALDIVALDLLANGQIDIANPEWYRDPDPTVRQTGASR